MIIATRVSMTYPRSAEPVFADVSFGIDPGLVVPLLGANGCGKTTLLRIVCGVIEPTSGTVLVDGVDVARRPREVRTRLGVSLYPERSFYFRLSCRRNLLYFASLHHIFGGRARAEAERVLAVVGLIEHADVAFMHLSLGQRRRLGLARSLLGQPPVLLLDEPTANLDADGVAMVHRVLVEHTTRGGTALFSTHHQQDLQLVTGPVLSLRDQTLCCIATDADIATRRIDVVFGPGSRGSLTELEERYALAHTASGIVVDVPVATPLHDVLAELDAYGFSVASATDQLWSARRSVSESSAHVVS